MIADRKAQQFRQYMNPTGGDETMPENEIYEQAIDAVANVKPNRNSTQDIFKRASQSYHDYEVKKPAASADPVNHPSHYTQYKGFEVIDVCTQLNSPDGKGGYNRGNAFKYLARAGFKDPGKELEDLKKCLTYVQFEIDRIEARMMEDDAAKSQGWMAAGADDEPAMDIPVQRSRFNPGAVIGVAQVTEDTQGMYVSIRNEPRLQHPAPVCPIHGVAMEQSYKDALLVGWDAAPYRCSSCYAEDAAGLTQAMPPAESIQMPIEPPLASENSLE